MVFIQEIDPFSTKRLNPVVGKVREYRPKAIAILKFPTKRLNPVVGKVIDSGAKATSPVHQVSNKTT